VNHQSRESGNKKQLVETPLKRLTKSTQCAVYGASMLSNRKNASHAITLLTVGELSVTYSVLPQLNTNVPQMIISTYGIMTVRDRF
jgi:hypothetical protein